MARDIRAPIDRCRAVPAPSGEPGAFILVEADGCPFSVTDMIRIQWAAGRFRSARQKARAEQAVLASGGS